VQSAAGGRLIARVEVHYWTFLEGKQMNSMFLAKEWGLIIVCFLLLLNACGPRTGVYPFDELDIPEQRVFNGFALLRKDRLVDAQREFERALHLQPGYSPAYRGLGLVYGMKKDFTRAFDAMSRAEEYAEDDLNRALAEVGRMSLYRMEARKDWLTRVERCFDQALSWSGELPDAYLELGLAYKKAHRFRDAEEAFTGIVKLNKTLLNEARGELDLLKKIQTADPRSGFGKEVVLVKRITRAESAGLLALEFPIDRIQERVDLKKGVQLPVLPPDLRNHSMKNEVLLVLQLKIQGLGVLSDGSFGADQYMTRAGFATVMADVLIKTIGNPELKQRYDKTHSPFQDVRSNSPHFTSIMICYDWAGIMEGWKGYFHPMETISGVDALLVVREAENRIKGK
jgi:tetratricopeptide (TPR) repeat protein